MTKYAKDKKTKYTKTLDDVYEIILPHVINKNPLYSLNRLLRKCYFKNHITLYGKHKAYLHLINLPYLTTENTSVEQTKLAIKDVISFQPDPLLDNRPKPYRYDKPIIVVLHRGVYYRVDGGKRLRHLHFNLKRKTIDVLLIRVVDERGKVASLSRHLRDRFIANLPSRQ